MEIIISNNSSKPIYEQITSQMKSMIMNGQLQAGDAIPSMRALAKSLHISVITVQKAYEDLQRDGFIETTVGRGSFVSARNRDFYQEEQQRKVEEFCRRLWKRPVPAVFRWKSSRKYWHCSMKNQKNNMACPARRWEKIWYPHYR